MKTKAKHKVVLTLSRSVLKSIDSLRDTKQSRSAVIDTALRHYLCELKRTERWERQREKINARDLEILNRLATA